MEYITWSLCLFILLASGTSIFNMRKGINRLKRDIGQAASVLKSIDLTRSFAEQNLVSPLNYTLLEYKKTFLSGQNKTTTDAADFIHSDVLLTKYINLRLHLAVPNLMVGMGIFGTFLGLSVSFGGLNPKGDAVNVLSWVEKLQTGMGTAFLASMVGMGCSLIHIFIEKWFIHEIERSVLELTSQLNADYLTPHMDELQDITKAIQQLEKRFDQETKETHRLLANTQRILESTLKNTIALCDHSQHQQAHLEEIRKFPVFIDGAKTQLSEVIANATTIMGTNLDPMTQLLRSIDHRDNQYNPENQQLLKNVLIQIETIKDQGMNQAKKIDEIAAFKDILQDMQENVSDAMAHVAVSMKDKILEILLEPLSQVQTSYEQIQIGAQAFITTAQQVMGSVTRLVKDLQHLPQTSEAIRSEFEQIIDLQREGYTLLTQNRGIMKHLETTSLNLHDAAMAIEEAIQSINDLPNVLQTEVSTSVKAEIEGLFIAMGPVLQKSVNEGLSEATKSLTEASADIRQTGHSFQALPLSLQKAVDDVLENNLQNILRELPNKLHEHLKIQLSTVQTGLEQTTQTLQQACQQFQDLPSKLHTDSVQHIQKALATSVQGLEDSIQEFSQIPVSMQDMLEKAAMPAITALVQGLETSMRDFSQIPASMQAMMEKASTPTIAALAQTAQSLSQSSAAFGNLPQQMSSDLKDLLQKELQITATSLNLASQKFETLPDSLRNSLASSTEEQLRVVSAAIGEQVRHFSSVIEKSQEGFAKLPQEWNRSLIEVLRQQMGQYQEVMGGYKELQSDYQQRMQNTAHLLSELAKVIEQMPDSGSSQADLQGATS